MTSPPFLDLCSLRSGGRKSGSSRTEERGQGRCLGQSGRQMEDEGRPGGKEGERHAGQFPHGAKEELGWGWGADPLPWGSGCDFGNLSLGQRVGVRVLVR